MESYLPVGVSKDADEYPFEKGLAVLFNHTNFENEPKRTGSNYDLAALKKQFKLSGFEIEAYEDLTKLQVKEKLIEVAGRDHSDNDCLAIVVMTHGDPDNLCAYDESYKTKLLWESFSGKKCLSLVTKPKLFFIQACRGEGVDSGVRVVARKALETRIDAVTRVTYTVPSSADILVAYSTYDGQFSFRNSAGSWFIQSLCRELENDGGKSEICRLLTRVNRKVAIECASYAPANATIHNKKQMPIFVSSLLRDLYFKKRLFDEAMNDVERVPEFQYSNEKTFGLWQCSNHKNYSCTFAYLHNLCAEDAYRSVSETYTNNFRDENIAKARKSFYLNTNKV